MEGLSALFTDLYTKFLLRDIVGKIVPGTLLLGVLLSMFFPATTLFRYARRIPIAGVIVVAGFVWTVTLGFQSLSEWFGIWSYFPAIGGAKTPSESFAVSTLRIVEFQRCADDIQKLQYERFVVIKEACGNLLFAMLLAVVPAVFIWLNARSAALKSYAWWPKLPLVIVGVIVVLVLTGLYRMHAQHVDRQFMYADTVAKRQLKPPPPCWQPQVATVATPPQS